MAQFEILVEKTNDVSKIYLNGYFDVDVKDVIVSKINELIANGEKNFLFNFEKTDKINSMGMAVIIEAVDIINTNSGKLAYSNLSRQNAKLLKIIGLTKFGNIHKTEEEALNEF